MWFGRNASLEYKINELDKHSSIFERRISTLEECCENNKQTIAIHTESRINFENSINNLAKQLEEFIKEFKSHDKEEMKKYDEIRKELMFFRRIVWIAIGVGVAFNAIYWSLNLFERIKGVAG